MSSSDSTHSFTSDSARLGRDSRISSQRFDSAALFDSLDAESTVDAATFMEDSPATDGVNFIAPLDDVVIPPLPAEMGAEVGLALREWRRLNAIRLEEKEKKEKEMVKEIIAEADRYRTDYHNKWSVRCENSKAVNREREKLFLQNGEKFHAEADKSYWKAVAELIPNEVPTIEKRGKKGKEKNPSIVVIQGPKPGKPTDLSRMRQILVKLKHKPTSARGDKAQGATSDGPAASASVATLGNQGVAVVSV